MKAITIYPEYCSDIYNGDKTIECRTWKTNYRGELLICAAKRPTPGFICGYAYFTVKLTDIEPFTETHLQAACLDVMPDVPTYAWHFEDRQPVYPFPVRGKMGMFDVDDSLIKYVMDEEKMALSDEEFAKFAKEYDEKYLIPITCSPDLL
jgi:hypothetical protein